MRSSSRVRNTVAALACALFVACTGAPRVARAVDVNALWDFAKPELSEQRFRAALRTAAPDDRRILTTQIARTYGLRGEFEQARAILASLQPDFGVASAEVQVRYFLELGRTYMSAAHTEAQRTPENLAQARHLFLKAHALAAQARLDALAIDALHMMAFVDNEPDQQIAWNARALAMLERSHQADARRWEPSLRSNQGFALHQQGDYDAALREFGRSRAAAARLGRDRQVRFADWGIAWTYRAQKRYTEAITLQRDLEQRWQRAGEADPDVFEELVLLYRAIGDESEAARYDAKLQALRR